MKSGVVSAAINEQGGKPLCAVEMKLSDDEAKRLAIGLKAPKSFGDTGMPADGKSYVFVYTPFAGAAVGKLESRAMVARTTNKLVLVAIGKEGTANDPVLKAVATVYGNLIVKGN